MTRVTLTATALFTAVLAALTIGVQAQDFNPLEKTYLTFSNSVELPGMTLPAGTYKFQLADTGGRNVVQVFSQDGKDIHGQFLFVQKDRLDTSAETVVTFRETPAGTTPAIQYWFYPNEKTGKEFVYPKDQAMRIARATGATVLSTDGEISSDSRVSSVDAQGAVSEWKAETTTATAPEVGAAITPAPEAEVQASAAPRPEAVVAQADVNASNNRAVGTSGVQDAPVAELPRTASPLALSGLIGLLSLAGALGLRLTRS